ncbi:MAG: hypothetical protein CR982_01240 [Candidatus Cloacimonadota bacterium]|nr:MAG: hypothetical protein CR982_01240 [Candidatus Cloacimonadota bacterium]PIE81269.1 MAG: hypothetical protein CSA15_01020 [Candidatus Delongbacteria bacterium]
MFKLSYRKVYTKTDPNRFIKSIEENLLKVESKPLILLLNIRSLLFGKGLKRKISYKLDFKKGKTAFYKLEKFTNNLILLNSSNKIYNSSLHIIVKHGTTTELKFIQYYKPKNIIGKIYFFAILFTQYLFFREIFKNIHKDINQIQ